MLCRCYVGIRRILFRLILSCALVRVVRRLHFRAAVENYADLMSDAWVKATDQTVKTVSVNIIVSEYCNVL